MTAHKTLQSIESIQSSLLPLLRIVVNKLAYFGLHCPWLAGIGSTILVRTQPLRSTGLALPKG